MATAQTIVDSARYDLTDYVDGVGLGIEFDDAELLNYLNRMVGIMDFILSSLRSDLVLALDDTLTTTANLDYVDISSLNSGLWTRIRRVWYENRKPSEQVTTQYMYYTRQWRKNLLVSGDSLAVGDYAKIISQATTDFTGLGAAANTAGTYFTVTVAGDLSTGDAVWKFTSGLPTIWALHDSKILLPSVPGEVKNLTVEYDLKSAVLTLASSMPYTDRFNEFLREMLVATAKAKKENRIEKADMMFQNLFKARAMQEEIARGFVPRPYVLEF